MAFCLSLGIPIPVSLTKNSILSSFFLYPNSIVPVLVYLMAFLTKLISIPYSFSLSVLIIACSSGNSQVKVSLIFLLS